MPGRAAGGGASAPGAGRASSSRARRPQRIRSNRRSAGSRTCVESSIRPSGRSVERASRGARCPPARRAACPRTVRSPMILRSTNGLCRRPRDVFLLDAFCRRGVGGADPGAADALRGGCRDGRADPDRARRRDVGAVRECGRGRRAQSAFRHRARQCARRRAIARRRPSARARRARQQGQCGGGARPVARGDRQGYRLRRAGQRLGRRGGARRRARQAQRATPSTARCSSIIRPTIPR